MDDNQNKVNISIDPEVGKGTYANLAIITHSRAEFILDFASNLPGLPGPKVNNRVVMTPEHAKRLLNALADNIAKYESQFGPISLSDAPKGTINLADLVQNGGAKS